MTQLRRRAARDTRALMTLVGAGLAACTLTFAALLSLVGVGLPFLDAVLAATRRRAARRRRLLPGSVPDPRPPTGWRAAVTDPATWRDLAWQATLGLVLLPAAGVLAVTWIAAVAALLAPLLAALPFEGLRLNGRSVENQPQAWLTCAQGLALCVVALLSQRLLLLAEEHLARALLRPTRAAVLTGRVAELTGSRTDTVDAAAMELRRIERDLHDGAQAQLTALTIQLGLAEQFLDGDERARSLVADARSGAGAALQSLRDVVHGIHPPLLAERGLGGAVQELALGLAMPVEVHADLPERPPEPVESALYFTVAELLTNAARHAGGTAASVDLRRDGGTLRLTVRDNGRGGVVVRPGGGLSGLRRRLAAFDGTLVMDSPWGGPTVVEVCVPCVW